CMNIKPGDSRKMPCKRSSPPLTRGVALICSASVCVRRYPHTQYLYQQRMPQTCDEITGVRRAASGPQTADVRAPWLAAKFQRQMNDRDVPPRAILFAFGDGERATVP